MAVPKTKIKVWLHHDFQEPAVDVAILEAIHVCDMKITNHPRAIRRRWMKQLPDRGLECLPTHNTNYTMPEKLHFLYARGRSRGTTRRIHMALIRTN